MQLGISILPSPTHSLSICDTTPPSWLSIDTVVQSCSDVNACICGLLLTCLASTASPLICTQSYFLSSFHLDSFFSLSFSNEDIYNTVYHAIGTCCSDHHCSPVKIIPQNKHIFSKNITVTFSALIHTKKLCQHPWSSLPSTIPAAI